MPKSHSLRVAGICIESPQAVSLTLDVPETLQKEFTFAAGQYLTFEKEIDGVKLRRSYSLCSTPHSGEHRVVVKALANGLFSTYANTQLKTGDWLDVFPPEGKFTFSPRAKHKKTYAAFAAGSGITPIMSIVETVLDKEPNSSVLLVYGNKTPEDAIFMESLQQLQKKHFERFYLEPVYSRVEPDGATFGRIDRAVANYFLKNKYKHLDIDEYYLCGPEEMIQILRETLTANGVEDKYVHFELFTSSTAGEEVSRGGGAAKLTIRLDDEESSFTLPEGMTVLDAALDHGLDPPYSCQGGICSTCIGRVVEGEARMRKNQILTDGEIADGLILTCQSQAVSPVLVVDYDDV